ncbi:MAG: helix-turn-helix domain-containing protein [Anaerolineales bacterium]|nr:helix-turn-helix domain-containing protein [Anaerolineales bacterium]
MNLVADEIQTHWVVIQPFLSIRNEEEYDAAIERLHELLDEVGTDETHPLYELFDTLGTMIRVYEEQHFPFPDVTGTDALRYLMEEHHLKQADLPELGSQGVVSEILNGKRELNVRQIQAVAERFQVSPAVFFG